MLMALKKKEKKKKKKENKLDHFKETFAEGLSKSFKFIAYPLLLIFPVAISFPLPINAPKVGFWGKSTPVLNHVEDTSASEFDGMPIKGLGKRDLNLESLFAVFAASIGTTALKWITCYLI